MNHTNKSQSAQPENRAAGSTARSAPATTNGTFLVIVLDEADVTASAVVVQAEHYEAAEKAVAQRKAENDLSDLDDEAGVSEPSHRTAESKWQTSCAQWNCRNLTFDLVLRHLAMGSRQIGSSQTLATPHQTYSPCPRTCPGILILHCTRRSCRVAY